MDYVSRSCDLSKMNTYDSESPRAGDFDGLCNIIEFLKKEILMLA